MKNSTSVLLEDAKKGGVYENKKILYKTNVENEHITCQLLFFFTSQCDTVAHILDFKISLKSSRKIYSAKHYLENKRLKAISN